MIMSLAIANSSPFLISGCPIREKNYPPLASPSHRLPLLHQCVYIVVSAFPLSNSPDPPKKIWFPHLPFSLVFPLLLAPPPLPTCLHCYLDTRSTFPLLNLMSMQWFPYTSAWSPSLCHCLLFFYPVDVHPRSVIETRIPPSHATIHSHALVPPCILDLPSTIHGARHPSFMGPTLHYEY